VVLFPQGFPPNPVQASTLSRKHMSNPSHYSQLCNPHILGEQYRSLSSSLYSFLFSFLAPSLLGPNILLNTLFSNILSLSSSLNVSDQVSHPYKTTDEIIFLYISIFKFLDIKLEDRFCTK